MTPADALQQKLASLPEPVQDYLYSEQAGELNEKIISRNGLSEGQEPLLFALLRELFVRDVPVANLLTEVKSRFNLDDAKGRQLAADIAGFRLLPLDKWLGDVDGLIRTLGGDPKSYPEFRVKIERRTPEEAAKEVVRESVATTADARTQARLKGVIESFLAGVRTEAQTKEVLTRPEKIGGVGLDAATAARVLDEVREETRSVVIDPAPAAGKRDLSSTVAASQASPQGATAVPAAKPQADFATITDEDEEEIARIKEALPAKGAELADETAARIDASIQDIYLASGLKTDDEAMEKRIKTVIGNRVRDVRDQMETLETMVQPKELGGLGLSQDAARALLNAIQAKLRQVHEEHKGQVASDKAAWVEKERRQKIESEAKAQRTQQQELEDLYASIVNKSKKAMRNAPSPAQAAVPRPPAQASGGGPALATPPQNLPVADANPVPPEFRSPAVVALPTPPVPPKPPGGEGPLTVVRPTPTAMPAALGAAMGQKPLMQDVKPVPRLTGPVEELRAITIVDFRRLSKDPGEAVVKIKDKIDTLAEQSYTRRNEGIAAWTASEVVRTYLELMGEGLNGLPLKDAVAARQAAKKPYLTPEEFQAVAGLMRQLRY